MALRQRARVLHSETVALLAEARQQQAVERQVAHLPEHGHAALFGELQKVGADMQPVVADEDVDQDRAVRNAELRAVVVAVFAAECRIQEVEQRVQRLEVVFPVVEVDAPVEGFRIDGALRGVESRGEK